MPPPGERLALALRARARLHRRAAARLAHPSRAARAARAVCAARCAKAVKKSEKERKTGFGAKTSCYGSQKTFWIELLFALLTLTIASVNRRLSIGITDEKTEKIQ